MVTEGQDVRIISNGYFILFYFLFLCESSVSKAKDLGLKKLK